MARSKNIKLTHFGRKSGKRYDTTVWWAEIDGSIWVGSQDVARNWVRNVEETGIVELNFGEGPKAYTASRCHGDGDLTRFREAILRAHPIRARIILFFARGKTSGCFRLDPARE